MTNVTGTNVNRPTTLENFVTSDRVRDNIKIAMRAAKRENRSFPHTLITSPPGSGKTTLANIIADEMGSEIRFLSGQSINDSDDISNAFVGLKDRDILFIDEIHAVGKKLQEMLYFAMEDRFVPKEVDGYTFNYKIKDITVILATNEPGKLLEPLVDRCRLKLRLGNYSISDISTVIKMNAKIIGVTITEEASAMLAGVSRNTPRIAINNLITVKDYATDIGVNDITIDIVKSVMLIMGIDEYGLNETDRQILHILFKAKKMGKDSLASMLCFDTKTLEREHEPYLMASGLITKSGNGRGLSVKGWTMIADELI